MEGREDCMTKRVFWAICEGMSKLALTLMESVVNTNEKSPLLNEPFVMDSGEKLTPLITAACYGHATAVCALLSKYKLNLEVEGIARCENQMIHGATALWCAANSGHLAIVKILVRAGANVHHITHTGSTPLRAACYGNRADIAEYLIRHQADVNSKNNYNNTCLMLVAYKGYLDLLKLLLRHKADPNIQALCGGTALHFAAECDHLDAVKELIQADAKITRNDMGMTPVMCAAERARIDTVLYFIDRGDMTLNEKIDVYELLGASLANDKEEYDISLSYKYLRLAMELRFSVTPPILKKEMPTFVAYENWTECQNLQELERIQHSSHFLHMEGLVARERILGQKNRDVPHAILYRGAVFADNNNFNRCIELWLHALKIRESLSISTSESLLCFVQILCQMMTLNVEVRFEHYFSIFESLLHEIVRIKTSLKSALESTKQKDVDALWEELELSIMSSLYLVRIWTKLSENFFETEEFRIKRLVHRLIKLNVTLRDGQTLLHLACNADTPVDDFYTNKICSFPCAECTELLIDCGANVNAMDQQNNTPLHVIVMYQKHFSYDFVRLHTILSHLLDAGAHVDYANQNGETPLQLSSLDVCEVIMSHIIVMDLKCLAANAVKHFDIDYRGMVPKSVESFVELHGCRNASNESDEKS